MLNSAEHEIFYINKYENANNGIFIFLSREIFMLSSVEQKEFAIVCNLRFTGQTSFMLSWVEHETCFIASRPGLRYEMLMQTTEHLIL